MVLTRPEDVSGCWRGELGGLLSGIGGVKICAACGIGSRGDTPPLKPQIEEETIKPAAKEEIPEPVTTPAEEKMPESVPPVAAKAEEPTTAAKEKISESITTTVSEEPVSSLAAPLPIAPLPTGTAVPVRDGKPGDRRDVH